MAFGLNKHHSTKHTVTDNPHYRIITVEEPLSIAAESYRRIKTSLEFANVDKRLQVIQICSSMQGEGKSVTALNIAATYAEDGKNHGQLEVPPDENEQGQEGVAEEGKEECYEVNGQRYPAQSAVDGGCLSAFAYAEDQLPQHGQGQDGRKQEIDEGIRHKDDAADNDDERQDKGGNVEPETVVDFLRFHPQQHRPGNGNEQP